MLLIGTNGAKTTISRLKAVMTKMTVDEMRAAIANAYAGPTWRYKVQSMDDRQVIAIYKSMKEEGRFEQLEKEKRRKAKSKENCQQLTIFDIIGEK